MISYTTMNALNIDATEYTPSILFDPVAHTLEIAGFSRPEDVKGFYQKFFGWHDNNLIELKDNAIQSIGLNISFKLVYFNSASSKCLLDILVCLSAVYQKKLNVKWHYEEGDEDLLEAGEEFSEALDIPFEYIETI